MKGDSETTALCPRCNHKMEEGTLMGNAGLISLRFQWYPGEPTVFRNLIPSGDPVGEFEIFKGPYLMGRRCPVCRLLLLES